MKFGEKDFDIELNNLNEKIIELMKQKELLEKVVDNQNEENFKEIKNIKEIKKIIETGEAVDIGIYTIMKRNYYEVETENSSFLIMVDYLDEKKEIFYEYFFFTDEIYNLHSPKLSKENTEKIVKILSDKLKEEYDDEEYGIQILHPYNEHYKKRILTKEEDEKLHKSALEYKSKEKEYVKEMFEDLKKYLK